MPMTDLVATGATNWLVPLVLILATVVGCGSTHRSTSHLSDATCERAVAALTHDCPNVRDVCNEDAIPSLFTYGVHYAGLALFSAHCGAPAQYVCPYVEHPDDGVQLSARLVAYQSYLRCAHGAGSRFRCSATEIGTIQCE